MLFTFNILFWPLYKNNKSVATFGRDSFYLTFYEMVYAAPCISLFFCPDSEVGGYVLRLENVLFSVH